MNALKFFDSLTNLITGMGTLKSKGQASVFTFVPMTPAELEAAYRGSWMARKAVDVPAMDMCRAWRLWQADKSQIELIEQEERRLGVQLATLKAKTMARLYGGAAILISDGSVNLDQELRPERIKKGGLKFLTVVTNQGLSAGELETDPQSHWYGLPKFYRMQTTNGEVVIHPSRMVRHIGSPKPDGFVSSVNDGWGDSILDAVNRALKDAEGSATNISDMTHEAKIDVVRVPGLMSLVSQADYESRFLKRTQLASMAKSMHNTLLLDKEEEWDSKQLSFATLPDVLDRFLQIASGAADIPATRFLGQSPAGQNSTGESDLINYYDRISSGQELELRPAMSILDECIIRSALGSRPPEIHYRWAPLWQHSEKDRAEINLKNAQAFNIDSQSGAFDSQVLAKARFNQCVEAGTYPGLEAAQAESGREIGEIDFEQPVPVDREVGDAARPFDDAYNPRQPRGGDGRWVSSGSRIAILAGMAGTNQASHVEFASVRRPAELSKLVGIDVKGFKHSVSNQAIQHSLSKHGGKSELSRGQKPVSMGDFAKLPAVIKGGAYAPAKQRAFGPPRVQINATIDGDRYTYVAEVRRGKRRIDMVTMWKK
ncbi:DUF1073 domain-containing protein [Aureimonas fodinaquatilis]|uniref:DUF1073 domain-containing protein n=1 Tax=Aureimonas fodinaquatilis TaxID=2565783 RepID=A0A5B0DXT6_9HYPH|nr:anti-CBASS Acb1 family protein [Aureimonas fodinaquatilis]KAA0970822.1 DUF1073 domain-containing protein [Aureimonas fodinaquatilis]